MTKPWSRHDQVVVIASSKTLELLVFVIWFISTKGDELPDATHLLEHTIHAEDYLAHTLNGGHQKCTAKHIARRLLRKVIDLIVLTRCDVHRLDVNRQLAGFRLRTESLVGNKPDGEATLLSITFVNLKAFYLRSLYL